jgi:hypothetical protein
MGISSYGRTTREAPAQSEYAPPGPGVPALLPPERRPGLPPATDTGTATSPVIRIQKEWGHKMISTGPALLFDRSSVRE